MPAGWVASHGWSDEWNASLLEDDAGRQLRLVPDDVAEVGSAGPEKDRAPAAAAASLETEGRPEEALTLADYVLGLVAGSECFCCGAALVVARAGRGREGRAQGARSGPAARLRCTRCGVEVEDAFDAEAR